jgi:glutamate carboxypeptidase
VALKALEHDHLSVNPAKIDGGSANNVVPDHAVLRFNIRPATKKAAEWFAGDLNLLLDKTSSELEVTIFPHGGITRAPKPVDPAAQKVFDLINVCCAQLDQPFTMTDSGGVCDGNNIAACGVPVVDTMGVHGGAIHSPGEFLVVSSLAARAALSALALHRLATGDTL